MLLITCGEGSDQQDKRKDCEIDGSPSKLKTAYCDCICQLLERSASSWLAAGHIRTLSQPSRFKLLLCNLSGAALLRIAGFFLMNKNNQMSIPTAMAMGRSATIVKTEVATHAAASMRGTSINRSTSCQFVMLKTL